MAFPSFLIFWLLLKDFSKKVFLFVSLLIPSHFHFEKVSRYRAFWYKNMAAFLFLTVFECVWLKGNIKGKSCLKKNLRQHFQSSFINWNQLIAKYSSTLKKLTHYVCPSPEYAKSKLWQIFSSSKGYRKFTHNSFIQWKSGKLGRGL